MRQEVKTDAGETRTAEVRPRLYHFMACPYCEQVRLALARARIAYESCEIDPADRREVQRISGQSKVPVLVMPDGEVLFESERILRWVAAQVRPNARRDRRSPRSVLIALLWLLAGHATTAAPQVPERGRPLFTYSIVARDRSTGELGVAVQSHWFAVGSVVPWAESGVGAVATQSFVEPSYGPLGLAAMRRGESAEAALRKLVEGDPNPRVRQVAFVDARGGVAAHTGSQCIQGASHRTGEGYTVQANLMLTGDVPEAMATAFERSKGPLAERLLAALEAAQLAGGDIRGKQSAALLVVRGKPSDKPWTDRLIDLRVEDHVSPLVELSRLLRLHRAYDHMNRGDEAMAKGELESAEAEYRAAEELIPDNDEFIFWHAVTLATSAKVESSLPLFKRAFRMNPSWMLLVPRLEQAGHLPVPEGVIERILAEGPRLTPEP